MKLLAASITIWALGAFIAVLPSAQPQTLQPGAYPFQDPKLPIEQRGDNIVSLLTLDEKIRMLGQIQPAIPRLGIKAFTNWTEGLHGLGWVRGGSVTATTFPQSVGLGETWDPEILRQAGAVEGYEARVYFKKYNGARVGLVIRAPNVGLARAPRWGRTEVGGPSLFPFQIGRIDPEQLSESGRTGSRPAQT
jgi:beta-glucosidase